MQESAQARSGRPKWSAADHLGVDVNININSNKYNIDSTFQQPPKRVTPASAVVQSGRQWSAVAPHAFPGERMGMHAILWVPAGNRWEPRTQWRSQNAMGFATSTGSPGEPIESSPN